MKCDIMYVMTEDVMHVLTVHKFQPVTGDQCDHYRHYNCGPWNTVFVTTAIMVLGAGKICVEWAIGVSVMGT
jgi:hypothetical protein